MTPRPPASCRTGRPRAGRRAAASLAALLALAAAPLVGGAAFAQERDSLRAGVATPRQQPAPDTGLLRPRITPRQAFLSSVLLPGYGQSRLDRPTAGALFFAIEVAGLVMVRKSLHDLRVAKRFERDSVPVVIDRDPVSGEPVIEYEPGRYSPELVGARRTHLEDWIAVIVFNHLFAGADAFVAAQLGESPRGLSLTRTPEGGARLRAALRW